MAEDTDGLSYEDMVSKGATPHEGEDGDEGGLSYEDMIARGAKESSTLGAAGRGAAEGAVPGVGGVAAGLWAGAATAPLGPWVSVPVGLATGLGAGAGLSKAQDWLMDKMGWGDKEQSAADEAIHPWARAAGEMAPALSPLKMAGSLAQRAVGAGIGGAASAAADYFETGEVDPAKVAMGAGAGAAFPTANRVGAAIEGAGTKAAQLFRNWKSGGVTPGPNPQVPPAPPSAPAAPAPASQGGGGSQQPPPASPAQSGAAIQAKSKADAMALAKQERASLADDDPMAPFWDNHIADLEAGKVTGDPADEFDASMGPQGAETAIAPKDIVPANDITTTAPGVAAENPKPIGDVGQGNPVGAVMQERVGARPSDPTRDYRKDAPEAPVETGLEQASQQMSTAPVHEDVSAALAAEAPPKPPPEGPVQTGLEPEPHIPDVPRPADLAHPMERTAQEFGRMDPVEASRIQRDAQGRALEAVRARNEGEQKGEAFQPETTLNSKEQKSHNANMQFLEAHDPPLPKILERLQSMSGREQAEAATKARYLLESRTGAAEGPEGVIRQPEKRPETSTGKMARSKGDAARKEGALAATEKAVAEFGKPDDKEIPIPTAAADKQTLIDRLQKMWDRAVELNGGKNPVDPKQGGYAPKEKPGHWQLIRAAKRVLDKPTPANIRDFRAMEKPLLEGGKEAAADVQQTARVEGDIRNKPTIQENAAEAMISKERAAEEPAQERPFHEPFEDADESRRFNQEQNELRDWLNGLDDKDYALLQREHPDLGTDIKATQDPAELGRNYVDALMDARAQAPRPRETTLTTKRPIKTAADLAPEPTASKGRVLDRNSPEFKAAAEAALKATPKANSEERIASERRAALDPENTPIDGSWKGIAARFAKDEGGAVRLPQWLTRNWLSPAAPTAAREAANHFTHEFHINAGTITNMDTKLLANWSSAPTKPKAWREELYNKLETKRPLTTEEQSYYDTFVKPLKDWADRLYNIHRQRDPSLPPQYNAGATEHVPRRVLKEDPRPNANEPWKQGLSDWSGSLESRDLKVFDDGQGMRVVFHQNPDTGAITILRNGAPQKLKVPPNFGGDLGEQINIRVKGKPIDFTVDHATANEIEHNVPTLKYAQDPILAYSNSVRSQQIALIKSNMLERIKTDQRVLDNSTTNKDEARERGYALEPTILKEMATRGGKDLYLDKRLKWAFDDFAKPGLTDSDLDPIRRFSNTAAKPLYILSPGFHVLNVADNWLHAMASEPLKFRQYPVIANESLRAIREVFSQGSLAREFQAAGGRLMYPSQMLDGGAINQIMQKAGYDLAKQPSIFDPITRATGMNIPELMHAAMVKSNKFMWAGNDMFALSLYQRNRRLGMNPQDAVKATHEWIGNYASDSPTFAGSRVLQKLINDPAVSWFGRYHQDLWRSYGNIIKGLDPASGATPQQRKDAVGALVMSGVLMFGVYPYLLDKGAQAITGNSAAEFGRRGMSAIQDAAYHLVKGDKSYSTLAANVWTPSIPANLAIQGITNKDWTGKDIAPAGGGFMKNAARLGDWVAKQTIPPYGTVSGELSKPEGSVLGAVKKFGESTIGIKDPSDDAQKYEEHRPQYQRRDERQRERKPGGVLEMLTNKAFPR